VLQAFEWYEELRRRRWGASRQAPPTSCEGTVVPIGVRPGARAHGQLLVSTRALSADFGFRMALQGSAGGPYFPRETQFVYELAIDDSKGPPGRALGSSSAASSNTNKPTVVLHLQERPAWIGAPSQHRVLLVQTLEHLATFRAVAERVSGGSIERVAAFFSQVARPAPVPDCST